MAARAKYPAPHEQLLVLAKRARTRGLAFDAFWEQAVRPGLPPVTWGTPTDVRPDACVVWPRDTQDRNIAIAAAMGARDGWRRAYDGLPATRSEEALRALRPVLEAMASAA